MTKKELEKEDKIYREYFLKNVYEPHRKELQDKCPSQMTEQELENSKIEEVYQKGFDDGKKHQAEMIHKRMNDINTFQCCEGELYLRGTDEYGNDFQVCFDAYDFLNWIDKDQIEYIKEQVIKHIKLK